MLRLPFSRRFALLTGALLCLSSACDHTEDDAVVGPPPTATVRGTIMSSLGAPIANVVIVVMPKSSPALPPDTTSASGAFTIAHVPVGPGTVAVSNVPLNCTVPASIGYASLPADSTITIPVTVPCVVPTGTVSGTLTSSLGGGIANARVTVTPTNGKAIAAVTTNSSGAYQVTGVAIGTGGTGSVAVSSLPGLCTTPAAATYSGLKMDGTVTVNVHVTCTPPTGSLVLTDSGPSGFGGGQITVAGPNGYSHQFTAGATISGLAPGTYTVTAANVSLSGTPIPLIDTATVTGSPVTVVASGTAHATVTYATKSEGYLWTSTWGSQRILSGFGGEQLLSSGSDTADLGFHSTQQTYTIAFDRNGNLWAGGITAVYEYPAASLSNPNATPAVTITVTGYGVVTGLAFDSAGDLWAAENASGQVAEYTAAQIASMSGTVTPTPNTTITTSAPVGLAFDRQGNLWTTGNGVGQIYQWSAATISASGAITSPPSVTITAPSTIVYDIAFDGSGNMWVTSDDSVLAEYTPAQQVTGTPTPTLFALTHTRGTSYALLDLAFDFNGGLWLTTRTSGASVLGLTAGQLATGGTVTPTTVVTNAAAGTVVPTSIVAMGPGARMTAATAIRKSPIGGAFSWAIAFSPHPAGTPAYRRVRPQSVVQRGQRR